MGSPKDKAFYGAVTVSERGQIVIPAEARRDFGIKAGDKLLVFGDLQQGLAFTTVELMSRTMSGALGLFQEVNQAIDSRDDAEARDEQ